MNCLKCKDTGKLSGIFLDCHYCGLADEYAAVVKWAKEGGMNGGDEESLIALYEHGKQQAEPLRARIAELEREVAANREKIAAEWRPIESAPKDGYPRLYLAQGFCVQGFADATGELMVQSEVPPHWRKMRAKPTHWMPCPIRVATKENTHE